jgi:hypothetical protein
VGRDNRAGTRFLLWVVGAVIVLIHGGGSSVEAQVFSRLAETVSPLVCSSFFQAEFSLKPVWMKVASGRKEIPDLGLSWDLRDDFALVDPGLFTDLDFRVQVSRVSFRVHASFRDFKGTEQFRDQRNQPKAEARLEYSGIRLGADLDLLQGERSRLGVNIDWDQFSPLFSESIQTRGGAKLVGSAAATAGLHVLYFPPRQFYGVSAVLEARARWPLTGLTSVTDIEISGGLKGPETAFGAVALKIGYRVTSLAFEGGQTYDNRPVSVKFRATIDGVFGEFVYYY